MFRGLFCGGKNTIVSDLCLLPAFTKSSTSRMEFTNSLSVLFSGGTTKKIQSTQSLLERTCIPTVRLHKYPYIRFTGTVWCLCCCAVGLEQSIEDQTMDSRHTVCLKVSPWAWITHKYLPRYCRRRRTGWRSWTCTCEPAETWPFQSGLHCRTTITSNISFIIQMLLSKVTYMQCRKHSRR